ncbi:hypothetical protein AVEN_170679-1 [Araneus ventricosus]|uniref:Uncharacterized protein n=1 Tax=Araneus ventricosus TaxID=182803 RepID=A0A4Y2SDX7_ARAVE|nr:hypothetical protein AVEN_170679-1 [Araneus ventricosus]
MLPQMFHRQTTVQSDDDIRSEIVLMLPERCQSNKSIQVHYKTTSLHRQNSKAKHVLQSTLMSVNDKIIDNITRGPLGILRNSERGEMTGNRLRQHSCILNIPFNSTVTRGVEVLDSTCCLRYLFSSSDYGDDIRFEIIMLQSGAPISKSIQVLQNYFTAQTE